LSSLIKRGGRQDAQSRLALIRRQQVRDQIELRRLASELGIKPKDIVKGR